MKNLNLIKLALILTLISFSYSTRVVRSRFVNLGFPAIDIGVSSEGEVAVVGTDNNVYQYDFMDEDWIRIDTKGIEQIRRLDIDGDGRIYIASVCGTYYLDCENRWIRLPGAARDIGVGVDFTVWKVGTDLIKVRKNKNWPPRYYFINYGIWKLICDCKCLCICRRNCIRFRLRSINPCPPEGIDPPKCYWFRTEGYGKNIDVFPNGDAAITVNHYSCHKTVKTINKNGMYFRDLQCGGRDLTVRANDITVGNNGVVYVTTNGGLIFKCHRNLYWIRVLPFSNRWLGGVDGSRSIRCYLWHYANRISAGPFNQFWFTRTNIGSGSLCNRLTSNMVYTSSRFRYMDSVPKNWTRNFVYSTKFGEVVKDKDGKEVLLTDDGKNVNVVNGKVTLKNAKGIEEVKTLEKLEGEKLEQFEKEQEKTLSNEVETIEVSKDDKLTNDQIKELKGFNLEVKMVDKLKTNPEEVAVEEEEAAVEEEEAPAKVKVAPIKK